MKLFKSHNWYLTVLVLLLCFIGITTLYSLTVGTPKSDLIFKQSLFLIVGLTIYFLISSINPVYFKFTFISYSLFFGTVFLLVFTLIFGQNINGAKRWIELGGFSFQASEFSKIVIILFTSFLIYSVDKNYFSKHYMGLPRGSSIRNRILNLFLENFALVLIMIPSIIIITLVLLQKSLSQSIVIFVIALLLFVFSKLCSYSKFFIYIFLLALPVILQVQNIWPTTVSFAILAVVFTLVLTFSFAKYLKLLTTIAFVVVSAIIFFFGPFIVNNVLLKTYQQDRIDAFLNEDNKDPYYYWGLNRQQREAKIAFGSGQIFGKGFGIGNDSRLTNVAYAESDFIFAAFGEQFGFLGVTLLFLLYSLLLFEVVRVSEKAQDEQGRLICYGVAALILLQLVFHVCVNLRILPNTGVALPLIGYGGSSLWTFLIAIGLVQSVTNVPTKIFYSNYDDSHEFAQ